jgi:methylglutaconyl-CoA hydratase
MSLAPDPVELKISPDGQAVVLLNRPAKRNAFDEIVIDQLHEAFETLKGADHVRIVFLMGAGDNFCAGADLDWMKRQGEMSRDDNEKDALALARMLKSLHDLPQFSVALVQGAAFGGGAGLVAAADYAVAEAGATFRFSEVRLGLTPATISPYVIEAIGPRAARGYFASALPFTAADAHRMGLVQEVVTGQDGLHAAMARLGGLAFENAPGAVADAKALVRDFSHRKVDDALAHETARRIAARRASVEGKEGLAAFVEKRRPPWDSGEAG